MIKMLIDLYQLVKANITRLMKGEWGDKIVIEFVALIPKTYSHLSDDDIYSKS